MKSSFAKASYIAVGIIVAFLLAEFALRLTTPPTLLENSFASEVIPWLVYDPILGWKNKAGYQDRDVQINSLGFHGEEISKSKPEGTVRIVNMGDSGTFGFWESWPGVFEFDNYPDALREEIHSNGLDKVEVINAGVIAYTSANGLRHFMTEILELEPDIVTLRFGHNDYIKVRNPEFFVDEPSSTITRWLIYNLHEWRLVRLGARIALKLGAGKAEKRERNAAPSEFRNNIESIINEARKRGIKVLLIDYPLSERELVTKSAKENYIYTSGSENILELTLIHDKYRDALLEVAQEYKVPILETGPQFNIHEDKPFSKYDIVHPNDKGAQMIGELMFEKLIKLGWLKNRVK